VTARVHLRRQEGGALCSPIAKGSGADAVDDPQAATCSKCLAVYRRWLRPIEPGQTWERKSCGAHGLVGEVVEVAVVDHAPLVVIKGSDGRLRRISGYALRRNWRPEA
jgi:hypothetical protein